MTIDEQARAYEFAMAKRLPDRPLAFPAMISYQHKRTVVYGVEVYTPSGWHKVYSLRMLNRVLGR